MGDNKRDLTRIEDLEKFLHELQNDETDSSENFESFDDSSLNESLPTDEYQQEDEEPKTRIFQFDKTGVGTSSFPEADFPDSDQEREDKTSVAFKLPDFPESDADSYTPVEDSYLPAEETSYPRSSAFDDDLLFNDEPTNSFDSSMLEEKLPDAPPPSSSLKPLTENYQAPENFEEVKKFAESSNFSGMQAEGNPSFSLLIKNVKYIEDVNDIVTLLRELKLLNDNEENTRNRLTRGNLLIPRISEFAAIYLAHRLRRFDIDIQVGLSDELHPPKHKENPEIGLSSRSSLYQNQNHYFHFDDPKLQISQIIVSASPSIEGYQVIRYVGVATEHKIIAGSVVENEASDEIPAHYKELAQKLKVHALKASSNAVVGLNYQLTPLPSEYGKSEHKYRLSCTGNLVWVNKL